MCLPLLSVSVEVSAPESNCAHIMLLLLCFGLVSNIHVGLLPI